MQRFSAKDEIEMQQVFQDLLAFLTIEDLLASMPIEKRLAGLSPQERLQGLTPVELKQLRQLLAPTGEGT